MSLFLKKHTQENPLPFKRIGPRPLGLYYALMQPHIFTSPLNIPSSNPVLTELSQFLEGVKQYHNSPYYREETEQNIVWQKKRIRIFEYGERSDQPSILLIPSMINKSYVFHLLPGHSLVEALVTAGFHVYLLDWGEPHGENISVSSSIKDYVLEFIKKTNSPLHIAGYCMGGLLALAAAQKDPQRIKSLSLLATPWDFSQTRAHKQMAPLKNLYETTLQALPLVPVDILQSQFMLLDPTATTKRFQSIKNISDHKQQALITVIEDWLADGVPLEQSVAHTVAIDWFIDNNTANRLWHIDEEAIHPENITCPIFIATPEKDIIVPPESCVKRGITAEKTTVQRINSGHIGMMVGRNAQTQLYTPYINWLNSLTVETHPAKLSSSSKN